jgi:DNA-binding response OmpR family regulator
MSTDGMECRSRILLLSEHGATRRVLGDVLAGSGATVLLARDVDQAAVLLRREEPDLVVVDAAGPAGAADELLVRMGRPESRDGRVIPVVAVFTEDVRAYLERGYDHEFAPSCLPALDCSIRMARELGRRA